MALLRETTGRNMRRKAVSISGRHIETGPDWRKLTLLDHVKEVGACRHVNSDERIRDKRNVRGKYCQTLGSADQWKRAWEHGTERRSHGNKSRLNERGGGRKWNYREMGNRLQKQLCRQLLGGFQKTGKIIAKEKYGKIAH